MQETVVKFSIDKLGATKIEVLNGAGESCVSATQELELVLSQGGEQLDGGKKPEYYDNSASISAFSDLS